MDNMNVLIFPAGSEIAIEIYDALKFEKDVTLFGATSVDDHAEFLFEKLYKGLPFFNEQNFIEELNVIINDASIDFIYPARDDVQLFLTQNATRIDCQIVTSDLKTVETCRSKRLTYELFRDEPFVPKTFKAGEIVDFPVFGKPAIGEGSKGAALISDNEELAKCEDADAEYVYCEFLPGTEYTVDCLTGANGKLLVHMARARDRTRAGISVRSHSVRDDGRFAVIAEALNSRLTFIGAWFFQLKERRDGSLVLMEVSPRVAGTMGLSRNSGINFPLLTLYTIRGVDYKISANLYDALLEKAFISRFRLDIDYATVYIDYDDTLYFKGHVNVQAMQFLYQCVNQGKRIVLLTRHDGNIEAELRERRIALELFDEIVHLEGNMSKADCVTGKDSILIDDSFSERNSVHSTCGIPVFEPSSIEALLDWRM